MSNLPSSTPVACVRCGRPATGSGDLCAQCQAELTMMADEAGTMLAPPADAVTVLPHAGVFHDSPTVMAPLALPTDEVTMFALSPPPNGDADDDATRMTPPPAQVDSDGTRLTPTPPGADSRGTRRGSRGSGSGGENGPLTVGDTFGRYTIVKLLGIGGMGAVYQAWDKELEVVVALKVIRPEVLRDPVAEQEIERRFKRELLLARQVTHRNVVRIFDLGEIDGIKYITMSYVDGKELAALVKEAGRLPIEMTLRIMRSVISGLAAAHAAGVIHRDLKPANIMIGKDGEALIMDFGIARSSGGPADTAARGAQDVPPAGIAQTGRNTASTILGSVIGTVEYMAPEQARGEAIDHRADIFTTGLILYDLLAGTRRVVPGQSVLDQLQDRMSGQVPALKSIAPDVPDALASVVTRAIEPDAAKRFQTTGEFEEALNRLDDQGIPKPIKRAVSLPIAVSGVLLLLGLSVGTWYYTRPGPAPVAHEPVSVIIADFENRSGDPAFDRTLEPTVRRALEGAGFITAYDRVGIRRAVGTVLAANAKLDETAAREIAVKQGLGVVLSGAIEKQGSRFKVSMKATQAIEGKILADVSVRASTSADILPRATELVGSVREKLGDNTADSDVFLKHASVSTSSLEVLRYYAAAQNASSENKFDDARQHLLKAIQVDPNFGLGYLLLAGVASNQRKSQEARDYINQAMSHLDNMTTREKLTTRGMFFRLTGDYKQCVKAQEDLVREFAADVIGHNQWALCASLLRDWTRARDEMGAVVKILPNRPVFRDNLAIYSNYAGDFATAEENARIAQGLKPDDAPAFNALGFSQMGQGKPDDARATFDALAKVPDGQTASASGLGDLAVYEGRYNDAIRITEQGAAADLVAKNPDRAAAKLAELALAQLLKGQKAAAVAAAEKALANSQIIKIRFLAARIFVEAGQPAKATPIIEGLLKEIQPEPKAYGNILQSMIARTGKDPSPAIKLAEDANALLDTWIGRYELGRAYLAARQYAQADAEFDRCLQRRGEALSLFLDEEPTFGYFPMVYFFQGTARNGMSLPSAESYRSYLAIREKAGEDPLIAELRRRAK